MMPFLRLLLAGTILFQSPIGIMGPGKYNISGTIYSTFENGVDKVMPNMKIQLVDEDGIGNFDDILGSAVTDGKGHFEGLVGEEDEEEVPQPYLIIPLDYCGDALKAEGNTGVWLPSTPERQNVSIYMGYKNVAYLHREGQEDLSLYILQC